MFKKTPITFFTGLNSSVSPELIKDNEARDILNFRMEKVGKLISRNGSVIGLFADSDIARIWTDAGYVYGGNAQYRHFFNNNGIIGLGELILEKKWDDIDTDRLMVYVIRHSQQGGYTGDREEYNDAGEYVPMQQRYISQEVYLFSPITGQYKNKILTSYFSGIPTTGGTRLEKPQDKIGEGNTPALYAPNKYLDKYPGYIGDVEQSYITRDEEDNWIKQYVTMNQYKDSLIISDMINGDMQLSNEYGRRASDQCSGTPNALALRPNALHDFDINSVELDNRFLHEQENNIENGVVTGMGLYKYELPKRPIKSTRDYFAPTLSDDDWLLRGYTAKTVVGEDLWPRVSGHITDGPATAFIEMCNAMESEGNTYLFHNLYKVDTSRQYVFTNELETTEYDDLLGKPQLSSDEVKNEDGKVIKEYSSNAFVWDDYQIPYYPCNGADRDGGYYLRDIDRLFTKLDANIPRILRLREHQNAERKLPLGVWKYRFVWDLGDEYYSAPSAEVVCPDIMWSAVLDDGATRHDYMVEWDGRTYTRPRLLSNTYSGVGDFAGQYTGRKAPYDTSTMGNELCTTSYWSGFYVGDKSYEILSTPDIFYHTDPDDPLSLTGFGQSFYNLKEKLYGPLAHRLGVKDNYVLGYSGTAAYDYLRDWKHDGISESRSQKGEFSTLVSLFYPGKALEAQGFIWEGAIVGFDNASFGDGLRAAGTMGKLTVPIFPDEGNARGLHSVFDKYGRYRPAYQAASTPEYNYKLLFPGYLAGAASYSGQANYSGETYDSQWQWYNTNGDDILVGSLTGATFDSNIYLGLMCGIWDTTDTGEVWLYDSDGWNTEEGDPASPLSELRPNTIMRCVEKEQDRLSYVHYDIPPEAVSRLVVQGRAELPVLPRGAYTTFHRQYPFDSAFVFPAVADSPPQDDLYRPMYPDTPLDRYMPSLIYPGRLHYWAQGKMTATEAMTWSSEYYSGVTNLEVSIYLEGDRFLGIEQLTSYFPSSILFGAPRMGIKIPADAIPDRAKRLLIFRTKSSHSNDYQPDTFGEVDIIDIKRTNGTVETVDVPGEGTYNGIYFFDDVKDTDLLYSHSPDQYEGLRTALRSRFNIPLNETVYYLNYIQSTQPIQPRGFYYESRIPSEVEPPYTGSGYSGVVENPRTDITVTVTDVRDPVTQGTVRSIGMRIITGTVKDENLGYDRDSVPFAVQYALVYVDVADIKSQPVYSPQLMIGTPDFVTGPFSIGLYCVPSTFDGTVDRIEVYRKLNDDADFYYIGEVEAKDEGIFVDDNLPKGDALGCTNPYIKHYESSMAWSEPNNPDWLRIESTTTYREGDGEQITGAESLYGNIVIFKENSMHRVAIQAKSPPISRTDEISPEIGCIAPNALINVNNTLYFLSAKGLYRYDNNVLEAVDGPFNEELQYVMANAELEDLRDASMGYNPYYNEIYLAVPMLKTNEEFLNGRQRDYGVADMYDYDRTLLGNIYVINIGKGYATKYAYTGSTPSNQRTTLAKPGTSGDPYPRAYYLERTTPLQFIRKYYTNSLGEMRSADIVPVAYGGYQTDDQTNDWPYWHAGMYIETPYKGSGYSGVMTDCDQVIDGDWLNRNIARQAGMSYNNRVYAAHNGSGYIFPRIAKMPVHSAFKSKFFTGEDETIIKRVRKALVNIFSKGAITLRGKSIPYEDYDERIDNQSLDIADETFVYNPSVGTTHPLTGAQRLGTSHSVLSFVPSAPSGVHQINEHDTTFDAVQGYMDYYGKPLRFSIEVEASEHTQLNEIAFWWRAIHTYLM